MNKSDVKQTNEKKNILITIKITKSIKKFIDNNKLSQTKIFYKALKELGFKE